jgi:hypothetical protein
VRRLNVKFSQIEECIKKALFAVDSMPRNPPLRPGELLLLQLVKEDADRLGKLDSRIEFALIFDHEMPDVDGAISRQHWPNAGKTWRHILVCRGTVSAVPLSLENLRLSKSYAGQAQSPYIQDSDEALILKYFEANLEFPAIAAVSSPRVLLRAIQNYDTVIRLSPERIANVSEHSRRLADAWPGDALKTLYAHRCQVCGHDFMPRYGIANAETRFIVRPDKGGSLESWNRLVVCPNHNSIISATKAQYDETILGFQYPNGLIERLMLRDHLLAYSSLDGA